MDKKHPQSPDLVREDMAAALLGFQRSTLRAWRMRGTGPAYVRAGRSIRYSVRDLDRWQAAHRVQPVEARS